MPQGGAGSSQKRQLGMSRDGSTFTNAYGQRSRVEYSPRYNSSKGRRFRGDTRMRMETITILTSSI